MTPPRAATYRYQGWPAIPCRLECRPTGSSLSLLLGIDTGAESTVLDAEIATVLGVDLSHAGQVSIRGFGTGISGRIAVLDIVPLGNERWRLPLEVVFVDGIQEQLGSALGLDYLALMDVTLSHANGRITLRAP